MELLGSWDNFAKPWEMKRDSRRGWGNWTGCHRFSDVIYDGDAAGFHEKCDGGLKMGGTYWYYVSISALSSGQPTHDPSIGLTEMKNITTRPSHLQPPALYFQASFLMFLRYPSKDDSLVEVDHLRYRL